jgi:hypothetical protein
MQAVGCGNVAVTTRKKESKQPDELNLRCDNAKTKKAKAAH